MSRDVPYWSPFAHSLPVLRFRELQLRDNVAQCLCLETVRQRPGDSPPTRFVIANVHVLFNPKRGDYKIAQVITLLRLARSLSAAHGDAPLVLAGDFNLAPASSLYQFLVTGRLHLGHCHRADMAGSIAPRSGRGQDYRQSINTSVNPMGAWDPEPLRAVFASSRAAAPRPRDAAPGPGPADGPAGDLETRGAIAHHGIHPAGSVAGDWDHVALHEFPLRSVHADLLGAEPLFTSCHSNFTGTCDYIFVSPGVEPVAVLAPPPFPSPLPSQACPSDHVLLLADLRLLAPGVAVPRESLHEAASAMLVAASGGATASGPEGGGSSSESDRSTQLRVMSNSKVRGRAQWWVQWEGSDR